jgi:O-antigen/teichoic acid export membrane protein
MTTLGAKAFKALQWTTVSTIGRAVIQIVLLSVSAHYLSATELGVFALVQLCLGFCQMYMDMGVSQAIIHQQSIEQRHYSELFVVNLLIASVMFAVLYLCSPILAWLFDAPAMLPLLELISFSFILSAFGRVQLAIMQKELLFSVLAKIELIAVFCGLLVSLVMLELGAGIKALVWGYLFNMLIQTLLAWLFTTIKIRPYWPRSWSELSKYIVYGAYQTADSTVNYINSNIDILLVGKLLGADVLGGYSLVRQFCFRPAMIINQTFTRVAFPMMAKLQGSAVLPSVYCKLVSALAMLNFPLYIAFFVLAEPIILLFFGPNWLHLTTIFRLMALWCIVRSAMNPIGALLLAIGRVRLALQWNSLLLLFLPISIYLGVGFGIEGVGFALFFLQLTLLPGHWWFLLKDTIKISFRTFISSFTVPLSISIIVGLLVAVLLILLKGYSNLLQLSLSLVVGGVLYLLLSMKFNTLFRDAITGGFMSGIDKN